MADWQDNPFGRRAWFMRKRANADGEIPAGHILRASQQRHTLQREQDRAGRITMVPRDPTKTNWMPLGPSVIRQGQASGNPLVSGRITALAVGPGGTRVYAGSANGGTWYSGDGGDSWVPLDEYAVSRSGTSGRQADALAVGAVAVRFGATRADDKVFVGTGEPNDSTDAYFGIGIKYSAKGGLPDTFTLEATNLASSPIYKIVIDPDDPEIVLAATAKGLFIRPKPFLANASDWVQVTNVPYGPDKRATDVLVVGRKANNSKWYWFASEHGDGCSINVSGDPGASWATITMLPHVRRVALAGGESDPSIVYAFCDNGALYRSGNGAFPPVSGLPAELLGTQGTYDIAVAVDPKDANTVYLAGSYVTEKYKDERGFSHTLGYDLALYKCTVTGDFRSPSLTPVHVGAGVHPDGHCVVFATNPDGTHDPAIVWVGTDGGPFASAPPSTRTAFRARSNGLNITQLNYIDHHPDTDAVVYAGCQDNGTIRYWGQATWFQSPQGDGGGIAVDPKNPRQVMRQYIQTNLSYCVDGGLNHGSWQRVNFPPADNVDETGVTGFYGPIKAIIDTSTNPTQTLVAFGTHRLWVSNDWGRSGSWVTLPTSSNPLAGDPKEMAQDALEGLPIVSIAFASATRIYVATARNVWEISAQGGTWAKRRIDATGQLPTHRHLTCVAAADAGAGTFYAGLGGSNVDHIWYYDGAQWMSAGLAKATLDVAVNAIVVDPANKNLIYAGTDVGVWKGEKTGADTWSWSLFSTGLPECAINDLAIHAKGRLLRAATHGRGAWEISLDGPEPERDVYVRLNLADSGRMSGGKRMSWVDAAPITDPGDGTTDVDRFSSPDIKVVAGYQPRLQAADDPASYMPAVDHVDFAELAPASDDFDMQDSNQIFVQIHNRGPNPVAPEQIRVLLLLANLTGTDSPLLPADYADRIANNSPPGWLTGSGWKFVGYATPRAGVSAFAPQIVSYQASAQDLGLTGPDIIAAVFVQEQGQRLMADQRSVGELALRDKHVAVRRLQPAPLPASLPDSLRFSQDCAAALLLNGHVLITDGSAVVEYDSGRKDKVNRPPMTKARRSPTAIRLDDKASPAANGKVLVIGGYEAPGRRPFSPPSSPAPAGAELFDPATSTWTPLQMNFFRDGTPAAALLANGKVLVAAGSEGGPMGEQILCELFDPATNEWRSLPQCPLPPYRKGQAGLLQDGRVFLYLEQNTHTPHQRGGAVFVFDPSTETLIPVPQPQTEFSSATMTVLSTGHVMLSGRGTSEMEKIMQPFGQRSLRSVTCEMFNPNRGMWRIAHTKMSQVRAEHTATSLKYGHVLFAGGGFDEPRLRSAVVFDPINDIWLKAPPLAAVRSGHTAIRLDDGNVLLVGGKVRDSKGRPVNGGVELYAVPTDIEMLAGCY